jgi:polyisoprenyl-phosphate glycosyltransferase
MRGTGATKRGAAIVTVPSSSSGDSAIAIIVPVLDDEQSLHKLLGHIQDIAAMARLAVRLVIVDDGSTPPITVPSLQSVCDLPLLIIRLSRNLGHQRAIAVGLARVVDSELATRIVIMDADGEDHPADIPRLVSALTAAQETSVVVAKRTSRSEGIFFAVCYRLYRSLFHLLTGNQIQFGNFSAMGIEAARRLSAMPELWINFPAAVLRSRLVVCPVATVRGHRYFGQSKMRLVSLVLHGFSAIAVFTDRVLTRLTIAAVATIALAGVASLVAISVKILGFASPGWLTSVVGSSLVVTFMACVLCLIGLLMTLTGGVLFLPQPIASYRSFIAAILGPDLASEPASTREQP